MNLSFKTIGAAISSVTMLASEASDVIGKVELLVQVAEQSGKTGAEKLAAVKAGVEAYVGAYYPALVAEFETLWKELAALIAGLIAIYNALGVFKAPATAPQPT